MFRPMATLATVAVLAVGLAACGDDDRQRATAAAAQPEPVAQIDALSGQNTEVTLDGGFVEALGTLKLTPGAGRRRQDHEGRASRASRSPAAT